MTALNRLIGWHTGPDSVKRYSPLYYRIHTAVCTSISTPSGIEWWAECSSVAQ
jgi:hypothetical protein